MRQIRSTIAQIIGVVVAVAIIAGTYRMVPTLGLALFIAAGLALAGYLLREDLADLFGAIREFLRRPSGRVGLALLYTWIFTAPAVLFYDPATYAPNRRGHIEREPRDGYEIHSDDVAYVAASRNWDRTVANLMVPHNTHIVPAWRLVTWGLAGYAGSLRELPKVLAVASYAILVAVMCMTNRLVTRETGRGGLGLAASVLVGTTSVMLTPAIWYSGGQPLWAGFGILATLWYVQSFRRTGRWPSLVLSALAAGLAGGFWSAGHLAGPVAAVYLGMDGRRRQRLAAAVPLGATAAAVVLMLSLASQPMDSKVSFHGRSVREAVNPIQGAISTAQAICEGLIFANLGLDTRTTPIQGLVLTVGLILLWASCRLRRHPRSETTGPAAPSDAPPPSLPATLKPPPRGLSWPWSAFNPLECAGAAIVLGSYLMEWTFRGYLEYEQMRTITPYVVVPWYDLIPQIGAVLFAVGWWSGPRRSAGPPPHPADRCPEPPTRSMALGIALMALALVVLNRPRVDALVRASCPTLRESEAMQFKIPRLQTMRANAILAMRAERQRRYLRRLDQAEAIARRLGIGQDGIRAAFGHIFIPGSTGRLLSSHLELYDVAAILDLPAHGRTVDPATIRAALGPYLRPEPPIRPEWLSPGEEWPEP